MNYWKSYFLQRVKTQYKKIRNKREYTKGTEKMKIMRPLCSILKMISIPGKKWIIFQENVTYQS